jgi:hypothetical protein
MNEMTIRTPCCSGPCRCLAAHFFDLGGPSHYSGNYLIGFEHCGVHVFLVLPHFVPTCCSSSSSQSEGGSSSAPPLSRDCSSSSSKACIQFLGWAPYWAPARLSCIVCREAVFMSALPQRLLPRTAVRTIRLLFGGEVVGVTWGLLSSLGGFVIRIRIPCIVHVSCMYLACILMCPVHIHQDTSRYIEIHLYLSRGMCMFRTP